MARYARKRKGTNRGTTKRTRSKRSIGRRRLRRGKMDGSNAIGVSRAIWDSMTQEQRLEILNQSITARVLAIRQAIHRAALRGKPVQKLKDKITILTGEDMHNATQQAAFTGKV